MTLDDKLRGAQAIIHLALMRAQKPVLYCSFGKDSMVMLWLVREVEPDLPVLFHREPFFPKKHEFANRVIGELGLTVYDYAPSDAAVVKNGDAIEIVSYYRLPDGKLSWMPTGIHAPVEVEAYLCGLQDLLFKPKGEFRYPWDVAFIGHKSSDVDPILGAIPLNTPLYYFSEHMLLAFPLKDWTDADIWEYTQREGIPFNDRRYDAANGFREFPDRTYNNDYYPACTACIDPDGASEVDCPKLGCVVPNVSALVTVVPPARLPYIGVQEGKPNG